MPEPLAVYVTLLCFARKTATRAMQKKQSHIALTQASQAGCTDKAHSALPYYAVSYCVGMLSESSGCARLCSMLRAGRRRDKQLRILAALRPGTSLAGHELPGHGGALTA